MPFRTDPYAELETIEVETSTESFDRIAFARRAYELVAPKRTTVVFCEGTLRVRVTGGRQWGSGSPHARWAIVSIPPKASRRSIALAVAGFLRHENAPAEPWALDVLLANIDDAPGYAHEKREPDTT